MQTQETSFQIGRQMLQDGSESIVIMAARQGIVACLNADDGAVVWTHPVAGEIDSLASANGTLYVGFHTPLDSQHDPQSRIMALRAHDGSERWSLPNSGLHGSPHVETTGDVIIAESRTSPGALIGISAASGEVIWSIDNEPGMSNMLIAAKNGLVFQREPSVRHSFRALDARTGTHLWEYSGRGAEPFFANGMTQVAVLNHMPNRDLSIWVVDMAAGTVDHTFSLPGGCQVLAVSSTGVVYALVAIPSQDRMALHALSLIDGTPLWKLDPAEDDAHFHISQLVVSGDVAYYLRPWDNDVPTKVAALNVHTGTRLWEWYDPAPTSRDADISHLAVGRNQVFVTTPSGLFAIAPASGQTSWHSTPELDLSCATPVVVSTASQEIQEVSVNYR